MIYSQQLDFNAKLSYRERGASLSSKTVHIERVGAGVESFVAVGLGAMVLAACE